MELDGLSLASSAVLGLSLLCNWISLGTVKWATTSIHNLYRHIGLWKSCVGSVGYGEACVSDISYRVGMLVQYSNNNKKSCS